MKPRPGLGKYLVSGKQQIWQKTVLTINAESTVLASCTVQYCTLGYCTIVEDVPTVSPFFSGKRQTLQKNKQTNKQLESSVWS